MHLQRNASDGLLEQRERGFTLVELMIVVAIIGILASLAVYMFSGQRNKVTAKSEVAAIFAEFKIKQEQHRLEKGSYLSSNLANSEIETWPPGTPSTDGSKKTLLPYPPNWVALRMAPETSAVRCSYVMIVGAANDATVGTVAARFGYAGDDEDWYYMVAECDMDQNPDVNSFYFQHSGESELFYVDQGK